MLLFTIVSEGARHWIKPQQIIPAIWAALRRERERERERRRERERMSDREGRRNLMQYKIWTAGQWTSVCIFP